MPWTSASLHAGFSDAEPWLPVDPAHLPLAVDRQAGDPRSLLNLTRRLVELRKACEALRIGGLRRVEAPAPLLAFERGEGDEALLCAFNLAEQSADWRLPPGWRAIEAVGGAGPAGMPPLSGLIAERER